MTPARGTPGINALCPSCGQPIRNAVPSAENIIRCGACNGTFVIKSRDSQRNIPPAVQDSQRGVQAVVYDSQRNIRAAVHDSHRRIPVADEEAINAACPNCGLLIANAVVSAANTVYCKACRSTFAVAVRRRTTTSGRMVKEVVNEPEIAHERPVYADRSAPAAPPEEDPELIDTGAYSPAQMAAVAYDRPERVALGAVPTLARYRTLQAVAWTILGLALVAGTWRIFAAINAEAGALGGSPLAVTSLDVIAKLLIAAVFVLMVDYVSRCDTRASWIAWRSASIAEPITNPPGSGLPFVLPWSISGGLLIVFGLTAMVGETASAKKVLAFLGEGAGVAALGMLLVLLGFASGEARRFFWRMAHFGKSLPQRKRGDEVGLPAPVRVQAFDRTSSAGLVLLALAFLAAALPTALWLVSGDLGHALELAFVVIGVLGIACGAYTLHRVATLWSDMLHGWEIGARSIGKLRVRVPGERATRAFRAAGWTVSACTVALVVPVVKTVGNTSVPVMLLSIFVPASSLLFFLWLCALKADSFRMVAATAVIAGPHAYEVRGSLLPRILASMLMTIGAGEGLWIVYNAFASMNQIWQGPIAPDKQAAVRLLACVVSFGLAVLPAFWAALTLLDVDRATANLESCRETE